MTNNLIAHLNELTSIYADAYNYILVLKDSPSQLPKNAHQEFYSTLTECFYALFAHKLRSNLAHDKTKSLTDMAEIINKTRQEVKALISPFEDIIPS